MAGGLPMDEAVRTTLTGLTEDTVWQEIANLPKDTRFYPLSPCDCIIAVVATKLTGVQIECGWRQEGDRSVFRARLSGSDEFVVLPHELDDLSAAFDALDLEYAAGMTPDEAITLAKAGKLPGWKDGVR